MKSRKGLLLLAIVLFGGLFFAFKSTAVGDTDIVLTQRQRLLAKVGELLEVQHYSPKNINDAFSKQVFKKFLDDLVNATYGWQVQGDIKEGLDRGVTQAPTFFINGVRYTGKITYDELSKAITAALKNTKKK